MGAALAVVVILASSGSGSAATGAGQPGRPGSGALRIVGLRPLVLRITTIRPGVSLVVRFAPPGERGPLLVRVGASGLLRVGVDATSCIRRIASVSVLTTSGRQLGSVRIPLPECAAER
jgi:hypothetical protein